MKTDLIPLLSLMRFPESPLREILLFKKISFIIVIYNRIGENYV